jgi:hypothetical protein
MLQWDRVKEARLTGREPRQKVEGITVAELCDRFLQEKEMNMNSGELSPLTFRDYKLVTDRLVKTYGSRVVVDLGPKVFAALKVTFAKDNGQPKPHSWCVALHFCFPGR